MSKKKYTPQAGDKEYNSDYWLTATKEEVKKFIEENINIEEYETKKKEILCKIQDKVKNLGQ